MRTGSGEDSRGEMRAKGRESAGQFRTRQGLLQFGFACDKISQEGFCFCGKRRSVFIGRAPLRVRVCDMDPGTDGRSRGGK